MLSSSLPTNTKFSKGNFVKWSSWVSITFFQVINSRNTPMKNPFSPVIYKEVMKTAVFDDELDDGTNNSYAYGESIII